MQPGSIILGNKKDGGYVKDGAYFSYKELYLSDKGITHEVGMTDAPEKSVAYEEVGDVDESISIKKYSHRSYSGKLLEHFAYCVLWFGERIYFENTKELTSFVDERFFERYNDRCPICGELRGHGLHYAFMDGSGLPYEIFVCSKKCLKKLTGHYTTYRKMFPELQHYPDMKNYPV